MKTYTIAQKPSGTGSIHDMASAHYDREIRFRAGTRYAVVLAAYYGDHYTTHKTVQATVQESRRQAEYSHCIIDTEGHSYEVVGYRLCPAL